MGTQITTPELEQGQVIAQQPVQAEVPAQRKPRNPFDSALILSVGWKWPSLSKTVTIDAIDVRGETPTTDKRKVHVSKDLFDCQELKRLFAHAVKVDEFLNRRCLPFPLKRAVYLLPKDFFHEVENFLIEHAQERIALIEAAVNVYDTAVEQAKTFLGPLFKAGDYPPKEVFRASFQFTWQYLQIGVSEILKELDSQVAAREADKMQSIFKEAGEACQTLLRTSMNDLVSHMVDRLTPGEDGRKKVFRDSMMDNINEFLGTFNARNLTDDTDLAGLVDRAKQLVSGISPDALRDNEGLRNSIQTGFAEIKQQLSAMISTSPIRAVRLTD